MFASLRCNPSPLMIASFVICQGIEKHKATQNMIKAAVKGDRYGETARKFT